MKKILLKIKKSLLLKLSIIVNIKKINNKIKKEIYFLDKKILEYKNVFIGHDTIIYDSSFSYSSKGDFFYIGNNCTITGATLLGHDASPTIFMNELRIKKNIWEHGSRCSYRKPINIGNNVFIGVGAIILPGINIGDNVIIAAGSIVTRNIESNGVYAGNPAKKIKSIDDYIEKYKALYKYERENF
ncbi:hypothetical protein M5X66_17595 [Providencia sp. PROV188]|uniref:acyltransferase n=1 Tax=Providencia sp. PROV188 TaxID=2939731 RepID=UPI0022DE5DA8|nr:DapH/DapD/GlmU-related protein [Providencia sp. PROV188]WBM60748.1 hypothetical protein M5X66_17595 [Providencia sp. PROV188]